MRYGPIIMFFWFPVLFFTVITDLPFLLVLFVGCIIRRVFVRREE